MLLDPATWAVSAIVHAPPAMGNPAAWGHTALRAAGDPEYEEVARGALAALWAMRTELGLLGYSLDVASGRWLDANGGIGASGDSCYEYLLKAYILFGARLS